MAVRSLSQLHRPGRADMDQSSPPPRRQPSEEDELLARLRRRCANDRLWSTGAKKSEPEQLELLDEEDDRS